MNQIGDNEALITCLSALGQVIEKLDNRGVVIGGIAVSLLARPRTTLDVDAIILLSTEDVPKLLDIASRYGFKPRISDPVDFAVRSHVVLLRHEPSGISVDISLGMLPFEEEVVSRSTLYHGEHFSIPLASPEDLVILKAMAYRPQDLLDIRTIVETNPNLDRQYIESHVREFGQSLDMPGLWEDIAKCFE